MGHCSFIVSSIATLYTGNMRMYINKLYKQFIFFLAYIIIIYYLLA